MMKYGGIISSKEEGESKPLKGGCPDDTNVGMKKRQTSHILLALMLGLVLGALLMGFLSDAEADPPVMAAQVVVDSEQDNAPWPGTPCEKNTDCTITGLPPGTCDGGKKCVWN